MVGVGVVVAVAVAVVVVVVVGVVVVVVVGVGVAVVVGVAVAVVVAVAVAVAVGVAVGVRVSARTVLLRRLEDEVLRPGPEPMRADDPIWRAFRLRHYGPPAPRARGWLARFDRELAGAHSHYGRPSTVRSRT